jgi:hypothetical protein
MDKEVVLSNVMVCCSCGRLYATGFQSSTPVSERDDRYEVPEYVDTDLSAWYVLNDSCSCGCNFFYRVKLPMGGIEEKLMNEDDTEVVPWGEERS